MSGKTRALLTGERTALNFLGRLSGIATLTASYVAAVEGTKARIACTRKTTPGLRAFEKYAVDGGGGVNHRFGLYDAVLVKDNHIAAAGGRSPRRSNGCARGAAISSRSRSRSTRSISSRRRCDFPIDAVLLDNMDVETLQKGGEAGGGTRRRPRRRAA